MLVLYLFHIQSRITDALKKVNNSLTIQKLSSGVRTSHLAKQYQKINKRFEIKHT